MSQKLIRLVRVFETPEQAIVHDALQRIGFEVISHDYVIDDHLPTLIFQDHQGRYTELTDCDDRYRLLISFADTPPSPPGVTTIHRPGDAMALANDISRWLKDSGYQTDQQSLVPGLSLIGRSEAFIQLVGLIHQVAQYQAPVLLKGDTGTGKEVAARAVHYLGRRQDKPFIAVNCGAYNDDLFVSELFGFEQGAFTDAKKRRTGLVEQAEGGTLFLDEIDSLSPKSQVALLRFLQDREYRPLGSDKVKHADVRLITASNRPLKEWAQQGKFRDDLLFRLDILGLELPALKDRPDDIPLLANHFLDEFSRQYNKPEKYLHVDTLAWMMNYDWPGNIRELENYIHRVFLLSGTEEIRIEEAKGDPRVLTVARQSKPVANEDAFILGSFSDEKTQAIERFERSYLKTAIKAAGGNIAKAARMAGKERRSFTRLIEKYGINKHAV